VGSIRGKASAQDGVAKPLCPKDNNGFWDRAYRRGAITTKAVVPDSNAQIYLEVNEWLNVQYVVKTIGTWAI
jgi:hypothetical protein